MELTVRDALGRLRRLLPVAEDVRLPEALGWPAGVSLLTLRQEAGEQQVLRLVRE